jgi:hypothetical protein
MSGKGIVMPNGMRYRISSMRRYIVVGFYGDRWTAQYRTDDQSKAVARWRSENRKYPAYPCHVIDAHPYDDKGPEVIR